MKNKFLFPVIIVLLLLNCNSREFFHEEGTVKFYVDPVTNSDEQPDENWKDISNAVEIESKEDRNEIIFRTINLAGVTGPEHKIIIKR